MKTKSPLKFLSELTTLPLIFAITIGPVSTFRAADRASDYASQATSGLTERAKQLSLALSKGGFIPNENFSQPTVQLLGKSAQPNGPITFDVCRYGFSSGAVFFVRRVDLFKDRGPDSLILRHLTNEILRLKTTDAPSRALAFLECAGFNTIAIKKAFRITVRDDLMDASPIRDGGPNFPKDLHFFGELISRKKIRIIVEFQPKTPDIQLGRAQMTVEFLATTGELLSAQLGDPDTLGRLGVAAPARFMVTESSDFTPVLFLSASNRLSQFTNSTEDPRLAVLEDTWRQLQREVGGRKPACYLLVDNLNAPEAIAKKMDELARGVRWAGISRVWNEKLPFDRERMKLMARDKQGLKILALCGHVQIQMEGVSDAAAANFGNDLKLPADVPDHAVFLLESGGRKSSIKLIGQLETRLRGKAQIFSETMEYPWESFGSGVSYVNGRVCSNTVVAMSLSGSLPLEMDSASLLRRVPEQRRISWELSRPMRDFAASFGPNPLQKFLDCLGEHGIRVLQQADHVEIFRLKGDAYEPPAPTPVGPAIGDQEITGRGKTQGSGFAQRLANAILDENNNFGVIKNCMWSPIIAFRTWRGKEAAVIVACFECNSLTIQFQDANGKLGGTIGMDFDSNRAAFLRLAQQALPTDSTLRKLKANE